jgi:hypothetical protein
MMSEETKTTKPGYKTTEFYLAGVATLLGMLFASGVLGDGGTDLKIASLVASVLATLGYTVARTKAKA